MIASFNCLVSSRFVASSRELGRIAEEGKECLSFMQAMKAVQALQPASALPPQARSSTNLVHASYCGDQGAAYPLSPHSFIPSPYPSLSVVGIVE